MSSSSCSSLSSSATELQNPSEQWRFTWEAQSHVTTLRLFLFNPARPNLHITGLKADLIVENFVLAVRFSEAEAESETILRVPIPKVLIDFEAPVECRAFGDHIEVKLVLLLPVDHPLVSDFDSLLNLADQASSGELRPLFMDSDLKKLSAAEEVFFYCRHCSTKLTRALRCFEEMPSVNWQDVADNWFGDCCCSFGGISEKLVAKYVGSYTFSPGLCHLSTTSVILCKDDLVGCEFPNGSVCNNFEFELKPVGEKRSEDGVVSCKSQITDLHSMNGEVRYLCPQEDNIEVESNSGANREVVNGGSLSTRLPASDNIEVESNSGAIREVVDGDSLSTRLPASDNAEIIEPSTEIDPFIEHHVGNCDTQCCPHDAFDSHSDGRKSESNFELLKNQKIFLNGYLGNGFMPRSSGISKDIQWTEFLCPKCSCLLGAYPCSDDQAPLDGRVRLFKCYISTGLPITGSTDFFKNYTLERMFTSQLLECAKDELSFQTVVRDLKTSEPVLQIVLLNPNSWCYTGSCLRTMKPNVRIDMHPTVKVLFSARNFNADFGSRKLAEWAAKDQVDEVYMLPTQVKELIATLELTNSIYPSSHTFMQGLLLSSINR